MGVSGGGRGAVCCRGSLGSNPGCCGRVTWNRPLHLPELQSPHLLHGQNNIYLAESL